MMRTGRVSPARDPALPPDLVARFKAALERLNPDGGRIGLAVSGGPDSMAMLLLAHAAVPGGFDVATVDHGLRAEAADECALVAAACAARGVACDVLGITVASGNVQAEARQARYAALADWAQSKGLSAIATAHHVDDQAETLLMRLNRGSGLAGLAGVREWRPIDGYAACLIRPVLTFRRSELAAVIAAAGVAVARDPSNSDPRFDRVRMRAELAQADWLDPVALAQSASNLADSLEAVADYAAVLWGQQVSRAGDTYTLTPVSSREMNRRLLAKIMQQLGGRPRGGDVARLLVMLEQGQGGNLGGVLATVEGGRWLLRPEPPRRTG
jgi:tRNA(Ile)-lysidine synthase